MQLRLGSTGSVVPNVATPGQGSGERLRSIACTGGEASWEACGGAAWGSAPCDSQGEAGIACLGAAREWLMPVHRQRGRGCCGSF